MTNWDIFDQTFVIQKTIKRVIYRHVMSYAWLFFKSQVIFLEQRLYFHEKKVHVRVVSHLLAKRLSKGRNLAPCSHCKLPCPINYNGWFSAQVSYLTMWWIYLKKVSHMLGIWASKVSAWMLCHLTMHLKWIEHSEMWHLETRHFIRNWKTVINCTGAIVISPFRPLMDIVTIYKYIINWKRICVGGNIIWPDGASIKIVTEEWTIGHWVETGMCKKLQCNGGFFNRSILALPLLWQQF